MDGFFVSLSILGEDDDLQAVKTRCTIVPQVFVQSFFQSSPEGFRIAGEEPVVMIIWDVPSHWFNLICSTVPFYILTLLDHFLGVAPGAMLQVDSYLFFPRLFCSVALIEIPPGTPVISSVSGHRQLAIANVKAFVALGCKRMT